MRTGNTVSWLVVCYLALTTGCASPTLLVNSVERSDETLLARHVTAMVGDDRYRNHRDIAELDRVANYIEQQIKGYGLACEQQTYHLPNVDKPYRNVVCRLNANKPTTMIIGAHYDVAGNQEGADDNASGVAGMIETARLLAKNVDRLAYNIEFVAYTLEEPPYFRTQYMGSYVHAQSIRDQKTQYEGMLSLEMIGFFSEDKIQRYPTGLAWLYPSHGNFIAVVSNSHSKQLAKRYHQQMKALNQLHVEKLVSPFDIEGIDFSDHLNYWSEGIKAVMITDTSFMRNQNYHQTTDTIDTLDFKKMSYVVNGVVSMMLVQ